jgi:hypothetical protein
MKLLTGQKNPRDRNSSLLNSNSVSIKYQLSCSSPKENKVKGNRSSILLVQLKHCKKGAELHED